MDDAHCIFWWGIVFCLCSISVPLFWGVYNPMSIQIHRLGAHWLRLIWSGWPPGSLSKLDPCAASHTFTPDFGVWGHAYSRDNRAPKKPRILKAARAEQACGAAALGGGRGGFQWTQMPLSSAAPPANGSQMRRLLLTRKFHPAPRG